MERPENFYDKEIAKELTGITNEQLLKIYVDGIISRIERIIGYELVKCEKTEFIQGVDTKSYILIGSLSNVYRKLHGEIKRCLIDKKSIG